MTQVSKSRFKARALEYFRQVEATGEPLIITDHGKPALEVRRIAVADDDALKRLKGSVRFYDLPFEPVSEEDWDILK
jgi:antitoxin (DNA-binding transcriptional repressor) of toxin-antitoxin stability system